MLQLFLGKEGQVSLFLGKGHGQAQIPVSFLAAGCSPRKKTQESTADLLILSVSSFLFLG
jgi:hypothetical protein